jgi:O-antigen biosynthesis protein WbqV
MVAASFIISLHLRLGDNFIIFYPNLANNLIIFTGLAVIIFFIMKIHCGMWRYTSLQDLISLAKAITILLGCYFFAIFLVNRLQFMPRSLFIINWMVLLFLLGGPRILYRMLREKQLSLKIFDTNNEKQISILIVGLNNNTEFFLRELTRRKHSDYNVVGIVDENTKRIGSKIHNVTIFGNFNSITDIYSQLKKQGKTPQKLLITADHIEGTIARKLLNIADSLGMSLARLPRITDFKYNDEKFELQPVIIDDLLGRAQNTHNNQDISAYINKKNIIITGCGGTIGSELTRQIASYTPSLLILIDACEYNLYSIDKELELNFPSIQKKAILADIRNSNSIDKIFSMYKAELLFHAAALKHVPLMEENACEAVLTNLIGTKIIADACIKYNIEKMVMISTDKAVNPTNIMGATKRAAESYIQALGQSNDNTNFATVRFGNVLGSSGSVIPLFEKQLKSGGPLTITHPDIERYFMTVREAVELVLQAATIQFDSRSAIFVLDMGEPMKIKDLAIQMIKMAGLRPEIDIKIIYTGLRAGEKLYEELFYSDEQFIKTTYSSVLLAKPKMIDINQIENLIAQANIACQAYDYDIAVRLLKEIVPEFNNT